MDIEVFRMILRFAGGMRWSVMICDVKTAFLLAPSGRQGKSRIAVSPPRLLIDAKLLQEDDLLLVDRALYGLAESPADWSCYRDGVFRVLTWQLPHGQCRALKQAISDPSLWFVLEALEGESAGIEIHNPNGNILAIMGVYVDDLVILGPELEVQGLGDAIKTKWKTSEPEWLGPTKPVRFCGIEMSLSADGGAYLLHQTAYLLDLIGKYDLSDIDSNLPDFKSGYEEPEQVEIPALRMAQKIVGELLWISNKTRIDAAFTVNKLGQYVAKYPSQVYLDGMRTLAYLAKTSNQRLRYGPFDAEWLGQQPLRYPRSITSIESWSDASFAAEVSTSDGCRSQTGIILVVAGAPVSWHSHRQSLTALSTAEAEMIAAVDGMVLSRAISPIWLELIQQGCTWTHYVDNSACVQLLVIPGGAWRTRHLRLRAWHFREAIDDESLLIQHMAGEEMLSDILTKPLGDSRTLCLMILLGYVREGEGDSEQDMRDMSVAVSSVPDMFQTASQRSQSHVALALAALVLAHQAIGAQGCRNETEDWLAEDFGSVRWSPVVFVLFVVSCWECLRGLLRLPLCPVWGGSNSRENVTGDLRTSSIPEVSATHAQNEGQGLEWILEVMSGEQKRLYGHRRLSLATLEGQS